MFGYKIIKETEYNELKEISESYSFSDQIITEKDNEIVSLNEKITSLENEINELKKNQPIFLTDVPSPSEPLTVSVEETKTSKSKKKVVKKSSDKNTAKVSRRRRVVKKDDSEK